MALPPITRQDIGNTVMTPANDWLMRTLQTYGPGAMPGLMQPGLPGDMSESSARPDYMLPQGLTADEALRRAGMTMQQYMASQPNVDYDSATNSVRERAPNQQETGLNGFFSGPLSIAAAFTGVGGGLGALGGSGPLTESGLAGADMALGGAGGSSGAAGLGWGGAAGTGAGAGTGSWTDFFRKSPSFGGGMEPGWGELVGSGPQTGLQDLMGAGAGGGSGGAGSLFGDITGGDLLKTGGNYLFNKLAADRSNKLMQSIMQGGNALDQPQRKPYQDLAQDLLQNPQSYMANNPFATALADRFKNNVIPSAVAKSGNPGMVLDQSGSAFANAIAGNYNNLAQILQGYGGFNQGAPNTGAAAQVGLAGLSNQNEAFRGFGSLIEKGFPDVFGGKNSTMTNPSSNSKTLFS